jgi:hypothetical protein
LTRAEVSLRYRLRHPDRCKAAQRKYREGNADKLRESALRRQKSNPERHLLILARHRAKKYGIPFSLTEQDIHVPEFCPILGIRLGRGAGKGSHRYDNIPSLDKIVPEKGYVRGNVWVISWRANRLKSDASLEDLERIVAALKKVAL